LISLNPYKQLNKLIQNETYEPLFAWGLRMAFAATVPVIWGIATSQMQRASWITIAAECICWVELKGSFAQRVRVLFGGAFLAFTFAILGSITGTNILLSVLAMIAVGFISGLFKNLGDRGSGLAVCVQVMFIIANAYPTKTVPELQERLILILTGGAWTLFTGLVASVIIPAERPFRRTIALIWRANANLSAAITKGWDGTALRSSVRDIYLKEKDIRTSLDSSFHFFETMAHQAKKEERVTYQLAQLRKATALVAANIIAISEELENVKIRDVEHELRIKMYDTLRALEQALDRMGVFVVNLKSEEELLINSRILRLNKLIALLKEHKNFNAHLPEVTVKRVIHLLERTVKFMQTSLSRIEEMGEDLPVFRSYSLIKTLFVLHPKHWLRNLKLLFNFNTNNARYALRSALAAGVGLFVYKLFEVDHGYWLPFTVLIVVQPYFTATIKKAIDRVIGTLVGGLVGGLLVRLPAAVYAKELMLFICFVFMVYYIRKQYSIAVFFVTVSVVLLFDVEEVINPMLIVTRALCTVSGAALGITAGFALLPTWDKKQLPRYLADAIGCNYQYFIATFCSDKEVSWTRNKRSAESKNSNAFDSFSRYMEEPGSKSKKKLMTYFQLINHSVRITRELNNIHLENEQITDTYVDINVPQQQLIDECLTWFNKVLLALEKLQSGVSRNIVVPQNLCSSIRLTVQQKIYLDKLLIELKSLHQDLEYLEV